MTQKRLLSLDFSAGGNTQSLTCPAFGFQFWHFPLLVSVVLFLSFSPLPWGGVLPRPIKNALLVSVPILFLRCRPPQTTFSSTSPFLIPDGPFHGHGT